MKRACFVVSCSTPSSGRDFPAAGGPTGFADYFFARTMALERSLLKKLSLPFGVALLAAATKRVVSRR